MCFFFVFIVGQVHILVVYFLSGWRNIFKFRNRRLFVTTRLIPGGS